MFVIMEIKNYFTWRKGNRSISMCVYKRNICGNKIIIRFLANVFCESLFAGSLKCCAPGFCLRGVGKLEKRIEGRVKESEK